MGDRRPVRTTVGPSAIRGCLRWASVVTHRTPGRAGRGPSTGPSSPTGAAGGREAGATAPQRAAAWLRVPARHPRQRACPSPHQLGEHELGMLPEGERTWVVAHLRGCSRCRAEQEMLRSFLAARQPTPTPPARLAARSPAGLPRGRD
jgi:hypothetical protein